MTVTNHTLIHAKDLFIILKLYVDNMAKIEEVEHLAACVQPLNDAICKRLKPPSDVKPN